MCILTLIFIIILICIKVVFIILLILPVPSPPVLFLIPSRTTCGLLIHLSTSVRQLNLSNLYFNRWQLTSLIYLNGTHNLKVELELELELELGLELELEVANLTLLLTSTTA